MNPRAGLKRVAALWLSWIAIAACERSEEPKPSTKPATGSVAADPATPAPSAPPSTTAPVVAADPLELALRDAIARGVEPAEAAAGSTWRIDPFVAALVITAVERDGARWLVPWRGKPPGADVEVVGRQIRYPGAEDLLARVGLRDGDIIETVSGRSVDDPANVRDGLDATSTGLTLGVFRDGYTVTLEYRFEPGLAWRRALAGASPVLVAEAELPGAGEPTEPGTLEPPAVEDPGSAIPDPDPVAPGPPGSEPATPPPGKPTPGKLPGTTKPSTPGTPSTPTAPSKPAGSAAAHCTTPDHCTLKKSVFDSMVSSPSKLQAQANVVPAIRDDVFSGYKIKSVKAGTTVHDLGFRAGDKITHINGYDVTDDGQAFALYLGLSSTRTFKVRYVRDGRTATKVVSIV